VSDTTAAPSATTTSTPEAPGAPVTRRVELVEALHGHAVADPYRWLEAPASDADVSAFVAEQNAASLPYLAQLPRRAAFRERLTELWDHPRRGVPWRKGDRWFQLRNDGLQDQDVLWSAPADDDAPRGALPADDAWSVLVDPNGWSDDGTASLGGLSVTEDGARAAVGRSEAGSDWITWHVVEVATGEVHPDTVPWSKFSTAAWLPSGEAFVYSAYDPPAPGEEHASALSDQQVRLHRLGTDPADDPVVHARPDQPQWGFWSEISHDGRWLVLHIHRGTDPTNRVHVAPIDGDGTIGEVRPLLDADDASYAPLGVLDSDGHGTELLVLTDLDAPLGRVLAVGIGTGERREVVSEGHDRLETAHLVGAADQDAPGWLVCHTLHHATARLQVHDPRDGSHLGVLPIPGPATVTAAAGGRRDDTLHVATETFTAPAQILACALPTRDVEVVTGAAGSTPPRGSEGEGVTTVVEQVRVHHDGVAIPMFLIHRADVTPDGSRATVLWGYGGFDIAVTPLHRPAWRAWVDAGGVLAVACLRGGGEYGRTWHDDGRLANKQHVFDDALACAAWLTGRRRDEVHATALSEGTDPDAVWSAPHHLGIEGRSNGGLLVGACVTQEPSAFGSAVPEVGVLDLTRFHLFTIGWAWTSDYGSPDDPDDLAVLLGYSPYHRIEAGVAYPATLVTTGDTDDRVVPAHSYKFAAALQHAQGGEAPVLLRVDTSAGHGAGKPVGKLLDERADVLAFHAHHLGL
jgi:prolyl oligopeptidase